MGVAGATVFLREYRREGRPSPSTRCPRSERGPGPSSSQLGKSLLQMQCLQGDLLFGLEAVLQALPAWVSNYKEDVSAKTYLTKNTSPCVIRNPKPGRIF